MRYLILVISLLISANSHALLLVGKVVKITDGDTITILTDKNKTHKVRLLGIDSPEKKQPYGKAAKKYLSDLIFNKNVIIKYNKKDRYGRILGIVLLNGEDINLKLVEAGLAWHYKRYQKNQPRKDRVIYSSAEYLARKNKLKIFSDKNLIPPWEWRKK